MKNFKNFLNQNNIFHTYILGSPIDAEFTIYYLNLTAMKINKLSYLIFNQFHFNYPIFR